MSIYLYQWLLFVSGKILYQEYIIRKKLSTVKACVSAQMDDCVTNLTFILLGHNRSKKKAWFTNRKIKRLFVTIKYSNSFTVIGFIK